MTCCRSKTTLRIAIPAPSLTSQSKLHDPQTVCPECACVDGAANEKQKEAIKPRRMVFMGSSSVVGPPSSQYLVRSKICPSSVFRKILSRLRKCNVEDAI